MRPLIGITPSHDEEKAQLYIRENYLSSVSDAGGFPVILQQTQHPDLLEETLNRIDGLLLSGGGDVEPSLYGQALSPCCGSVDSARDAFEFALLKGAFARRIPIFGICRGAQVLGVALGATLFQDIEDECGIPASRHRQSPPYDRPVHSISLTHDGLFERLTHKSRLQVNSAHHQAIAKPGPEMIVEAISDDGIVEGFRRIGDDAVFAVQFHPEHMAAEDVDAACFFRYHIECAKAYRTRRETGHP